MSISLYYYFDITSILIYNYIGTFSHYSISRSSYYAFIISVYYHISTLWQETNYCNVEDLTKIITWRNIPAMPSSQKCACGSWEDHQSWCLWRKPQLHLLPEQTSTRDRREVRAKLITCQRNTSGICLWPKKKHLEGSHRKRQWKPHHPKLIGRGNKPESMPSKLGKLWYFNLCLHRGISP